jgi:hypothetical protein
MKKSIIIILFVTLASIGFELTAQVPPPPPDGHGGDTNQPANGSAPIGSGLGILLALGAAYGGKKVWDYRRKLEE